MFVGQYLPHNTTTGMNTTINSIWKDLNKEKSERKIWAARNKDKLIKVLKEENQERMDRYRSRAIKTWDWDKYWKDLDRQREFMTRRILSVLWNI